MSLPVRESICPSGLRFRLEPAALSVPTKLMTDLHLFGKRLEQYCWHPKNVALILRYHYPKSIVIACSRLRPKRQVDNVVVNLADNPIAPLSLSLEGVEMAISLFCYSSHAAEDVEGILDLLSVRHREFFAGKFLLSSVDDLEGAATCSDSISLEIALEHGMRASCFFLIYLNDKSAAGLLPKVETIIKNALGDSNVLILFNNEERR